MGLRLCELFSGSILVELVFAWPGIGRLLVDSINERDLPHGLGLRHHLCRLFLHHQPGWWICCTSSSTPVSDNSSHTDLGIPNRSAPRFEFFRTFFNLQPCQTPSFPYNKIIFSRKEF